MLQPAHITFAELVSVVKRRKMLLLLPPLAVTALCVAVTFFLPRMYESSTRLLVQRTEVANPLTNLANAMMQTDDDPLQYFDEIISSRRTIEALIDSLGIQSGLEKETDRRLLGEAIRSRIKTRTHSRESFSITFQDTDPVRAKRGVEVLTNIFIHTVSKTKNQRNEMTVRFYEEKLNEFRSKYEESQRQFLTTLRQSSRGTTGANNYLYTRLDQLEEQIQDAEKNKGENVRRLEILQNIPDLMGTNEGRQNLYELQRSNIPYVENLRPLLATYDQVTQRYTSKHPEVLNIQSQILTVLDRMRVALNSELAKQESQLNDLRKTRTRLGDEIMRSSVVQQQDRDKESNYSMYQRLYNEMKMKLEEAQISLTLGKDAENQFIIMEPALIPLFPSKPSRIGIILGGLASGIFLGILSTIIAELLDTRIWKAREIEFYQKPIVGLLPEVRRKD